MKPTQRIAIIGFGLEGRALFSFLFKKGARDITILDKSRDLKIPIGAKEELGNKYLDHLERFDLIFRSPGVPLALPQFQKINNKLFSLTRLFFEYHKGKIIGVTGSAGKTTTVTLLEKMLRAGGKDVYLGGNVGVSALTFLPKLGKKSISVLELSSFQLHDLQASPDIAVILDIYEEHLDKHKNFREYLGAKGNIARYQKMGDIIIYNFDNAYSKKLARLSPAHSIAYSLNDERADLHIKEGWILSKRAGKLISLDSIKLFGLHNLKNIMAASAAALASGIRVEVIRRTVSTFSGLEHRIEFVRELRGVRFYNDSKATNVGSAIAGIDAFDAPKVVLSGGYNKNLNLMPLADRLVRKDIRHIVCFGQARHELANKLRKLGCHNFTMASKLSVGVQIANRKSKPGDVVILSPGTASFDEFKNYSERGRKFKEWV